MTKNLIKKSLVLVSTLMLTASVYAQLNQPQIPQTAGGNSGSSVGSSLNNIVAQFKNISTGIYSSLFIVALILFFVGMFKYLLPGKAAEDKQAGLKQMGFGILVLFVMVGIWGLVAFLSSNLGIGVGGDIPTPGVPTGVRTYNF